MNIKKKIDKTQVVTKRNLLAMFVLESDMSDFRVYLIKLKRLKLQYNVQ